MRRASRAGGRLRSAGALLALGLLARAAHAEPVGDHLVLAGLVVAVEHDAIDCLEPLAAAQRRGISSTTVVRVRDPIDVSKYGGRSRHAHRFRVYSYTLRELRSQCAARVRRHAADAMRMRIRNASRHPEVWRETCLEYWPKTLAKGVLPSESYPGFILSDDPLVEPVSLEAAYQRYCVGEAEST